MSERYFLNVFLWIPCFLAISDMGTPVRGMPFGRAARSAWSVVGGDRIFRWRCQSGGIFNRGPYRDVSTVLDMTVVCWHIYCLPHDNWVLFSYGVEYPIGDLACCWCEWQHSLGTAPPSLCHESMTNRSYTFRNSDFSWGQIYCRL